jgi:putative toxin-antitoxin system antitoxin component (TIGR02293 family)
MAHLQSAQVHLDIDDSGDRRETRRTRAVRKTVNQSWPPSKLVGLAFEARKGLSKADAAVLFKRVAATSARPLGRVRAELIPDSSWKRAGETLGPLASQTTARLSHILSIAAHVWGNEGDGTEWLVSPHPELQGATPFSLLKTEAGGRAVEALLGSLEFGFPV